jgi:hypothetical protein
MQNDDPFASLEVQPESVNKDCVLFFFQEDAMQQVLLYNYEKAANVPKLEC